MNIAFDQLKETVAYCDPAGGKKGAAQLKRTRARATVVVIAQDFLFRIFVLKAWASRGTTDRLTDEIFKTQEEFPHIKRFGIEANGMQSLYGDSLQRIAREKSIKIPLEPWFLSTRVEKTWRMRTTFQPALAAGRVFIQPQHHELLSEIEGFPTAATMDLFDALCSAMDMLSPPRNEQAAVFDEAQAIAEYLRQTGAPAWHIEQRVKEIRLRQ